MTEKTIQEEVDELLGGQVRDELAVQCRADHIAALACAAAGAGFALIHRQAELAARVSLDDPAVDDFVNAAIELEKALYQYRHDTRRQNGREIAYTAIALGRLGNVGADWIMRGVERISEIRRERVAAHLASLR